MKPVMRQALITDLPFVYRGELAYITCWEPLHLAQWRQDVEQHMRRWVDNFERLTIATLEGQPVGYCQWMIQADRAELSTIVVDDPYRGQGIGRALLAAYMNSARQAGFTQLWLSVKPQNPAKRLYEQAGFQQVGVARNGYLHYERRCT